MLAKPSHSTRYEKRAPLGEGPDSRVWRAHDHELRRTVVIKTLREERISESAGFVAGARNIASIRHALIVQIHNIVDSGEGLSIISDHVEGGGSLADRLTMGPCDASHILEWGAQVAETLAFIHAKGIIHADITPANTLLTKDGQALLSNFCLARTFASAPATAIKAEKWCDLPTGTVLGNALEPSGDVFSLGNLLLEALSGRHEPMHRGSVKPTQGPPDRARAVSAPLQGLLARCVPRRHSNAPPRKNWPPCGCCNLQRGAGKPGSGPDKGD